MILFDLQNPTWDELYYFKEKYKEGSKEECWLWTGYKLKSGHGQFRYRRKTIYAYRFMYALVNGPFDDFLCVLHKCDNGACVNPNHLYLGTKQDNTNDMMNRGRYFYSGFLQEEDIIEIYKLAKQGLNQKQLADKFQVDQSQISKILSGHRWGHIYKKYFGTEIAI